MEGFLGGFLLVILGLIVVLFYLRAKSNRSAADAENRSENRESSLQSLSSSDIATNFSQPKAQPQFLANMIPSNLLMISVFAKSNNRFASYDLLQAIAATGLQYGEMNIFHYYQRSPQGKKIILFSLASATKPGGFDLDRMGNFSCVGLTLFMDITQVPNPLQAFYLMLGTAEQLADDLEGELRAAPHIAWSDEYFQICEQKIMKAQAHERQILS
jgi:cell division protein ZipA